MFMPTGASVVAPPGSASACPGSRYLTGARTSIWLLLHTCVGTPVHCMTPGHPDTMTLGHCATMAPPCPMGSLAEGWMQKARQKVARVVLDEDAWWGEQQLAKGSWGWTCGSVTTGRVGCEAGW